MTTVKEKIGNGYIDDEDDFKPYADVASEMDVPFPDNASIIQGTDNLKAFRRNVEYEDRTNAMAEADARNMREHAVAAVALANAGPHDLLGEHTSTQLKVLKAASDMSRYQGGEKAGYQTKDFNNRYDSRAPSVEKGARINHLTLVNKTFPELLKASQLIEAGFDEHDVNDMVNKTRIQLKLQYGGPDNEKARRSLRAELKRK